MGLSDLPGDGRRVSGRGWLLVVAVGLVIGLAAVVWPRGVGAEEPSVSLLETQISGDIESAKRGATALEWGGGSLYRLKMRLATKGCILDLVWAYDAAEARWYGYNQYHVPYQFNQPFLDKFESFIPAGTIWAQCFDRCEFADDGSYDNPHTGRSPRGETDCISFWRYALWADPRDARGSYQENGATCTYDFHQVLKEHLFPILPLTPGLCIIRYEGGAAGLYTGSSNFSQDEFYGPEGHSNRDLFARSQYFISVGAYEHVLDGFSSRPLSIYNSDGSLYDASVAASVETATHEICHAFQEWSRMQLLISTDSTTALEYYYAAHFDEAVGFEEGEDRGYLLPEGHIYNYVYAGDTSGGLFAELCMLYAFERMGLPNSKYYIGYLDSTETYDDYFTPEIRAFFAEWVFLPYE